MYEPPPFGYARTVCRYDTITMISTVAMTTAMGMR
jgi:hypothetical protein